MNVVGNPEFSSFFPPSGSFRAIVRNDDRVLHLNESAAAVWALLETPTTVGAIAALLREDLGLLVDHDAVQTVVDELASVGLLADSDGDPAADGERSGSGSVSEVRPLPRDPDP